jgi:hypothetical protein
MAAMAKRFETLTDFPNKTFETDATRVGIDLTIVKRLWAQNVSKAAVKENQQNSNTFFTPSTVGWPMRGHSKILLSSSRVYCGRRKRDPETNSNRNPLFKTIARGISQPREF